MCVCVYDTYISLPKYTHVHMQTYAHTCHFIIAKLKLRFVFLTMLTKGPCSIIGKYLALLEETGLAD